MQRRDKNKPAEAVSAGITRRAALGSLGTLAAVPSLALYGCAGSDATGASLARDIRQSVGGTVFARGENGYEGVRANIWCANVPERYPAAIVRARSSESVSAAVKYARRNGMRIAIRGGGHNWSAASLRDDALMIDVGGMSGLEIDPDRRIANVQPGVSGGRLFQIASDHGLTFPIAHCPSVPMSGFLLNGGYGFNAGSWGPSAMLIEAMEIVTPDGDIVQASESENPDLFWAARGAGPSFFGIVTSFRLRLLPIPTSVNATTYIFPLDATAEVTAAVDAVRDDIPDTVELSFLAAAGAGPPTTPAVGIVSALSFRDDDAEARRDLRFLTDFAIGREPVVAERAVPVDWPTLFESVAALFPPKANYLGNTIWSDGLLTDIYSPYAEHLSTAPTPQAFSNCITYAPGFAERASRYDAALSMQGQIIALHYAIWSDPSEAAVNEEWFRASTDLFAQHAKGNYIGETDLNLYPEFARTSYSSDAWRQLASLRDRHDPDRRFFDFLGQENQT